MYSFNIIMKSLGKFATVCFPKDDAVLYLLNINRGRIYEKCIFSINIVYSDKVTMYPPIFNR